jgi:ABC-type branched-subunit amino acid transport system ATPase component
VEVFAQTATTLFLTQLRLLEVARAVAACPPARMALLEALEAVEETG